MLRNYNAFNSFHLNANAVLIKEKDFIQNKSNFFSDEISIQTRNLYSLSSRRGFMIIEKISEIACCITNDYSARITWAVEMDPARPY